MVTWWHRIMLLLFGALDWRCVAYIMVPGVISGGVVWLLHDGEMWQRITLGILTIDLVSGAVSNATSQTNAQWRVLALWQQGLFVISHLLIYPLLLTYLDASNGFFWSMIAVLLIKIALFVRGILWE